MFAKEWLPYALSIEIKECEFWNMTKRSLDAHIEGHKLKKRQIDEMCHLLGFYFRDALMSSNIGNSELFKDKKAQPFEYPKEPYLEMSRIKNGELTENELFNQRMEYVKRCKERKRLFDENHKNQERN